mmetsp:Transcript_32336/g.59125  ORF Transcript_32336/g.59125 Transcript_32336/m.59125 type:complete len:257 (-) Transcript_32336:419-1189(-)
MHTAFPSVCQHIHHAIYYRSSFLSGFRCAEPLLSLFKESIPVNSARMRLHYPMHPFPQWSLYVEPKDEIGGGGARGDNGSLHKRLAGRTSKNALQGEKRFLLFRHCGCFQICLRVEITASRISSDFSILGRRFPRSYRRLHELWRERLSSRRRSLHLDSFLCFLLVHSCSRPRSICSRSTRNFLFFILVLSSSRLSSSFLCFLLFLGSLENTPLRSSSCSCRRHNRNFPCFLFALCRLGRKSIFHTLANCLHRLGY